MNSKSNIKYNTKEGYKCNLFYCTGDVKRKLLMDFSAYVLLNTIIFKTSVQKELSLNTSIVFTTVSKLTHKDSEKVEISYSKCSQLSI